MKDVVGKLDCIEVNSPDVWDNLVVFEAEEKEVWIDVNEEVDSNDIVAVAVGKTVPLDASDVIDWIVVSVCEVAFVIDVIWIVEVVLVTVSIVEFSSGEKDEVGWVKVIKEVGKLELSAEEVVFDTDVGKVTLVVLGWTLLLSVLFKLLFDVE